MCKTVILVLLSFIFGLGTMTASAQDTREALSDRHNSVWKVACEKSSKRLPCTVRFFRRSYENGRSLWLLISLSLNEKNEPRLSVVIPRPRKVLNRRGTSYGGMFFGIDDWRASLNLHEEDCGPRVCIIGGGYVPQMLNRLLAGAYLYIGVPTDEGYGFSYAVPLEGLKDALIAARIL